MHLLNVTLGGNDLIRLVLEIEKNRNFLRNYPMKGMGFRGKILGRWSIMESHMILLTIKSFGRTSQSI